MGFGKEELPLLFTSHPSVLVNPSAIPLVLVISRNRGFIARDLEPSVAPKVALLKEYGISGTEIVHILRRGRGFIRWSLESTEALLRKVQELGFDVKSPMFERVGLKRRWNSLGGSGGRRRGFFLHLRKPPYFIHLSKENVHAKMDFLVKEAGCEQSYISSSPLLLTLSLETRLKPRYHVLLQLLKSNEIVHTRSLWYVMPFSDKNFLLNILLRNKEKVPKHP
ncbi:uncharacterized protein A4U43_C08F21900 [Asparagus officinalis]|uniref:uncharacterized protein LOC109820245 n=1 Tax=Asparagus officinalis TaxID=4686 RepID=UPI00098E3CB7|nr:uncharacterized protein LOC109820245 [Asparagus officinalis]ONK60724.1 uncharacterized protein A4U43_C08F21900 [Asparagus officinalis]